MSFTKLFFILFAILTARYFIGAGGAYWYFWKFKKKESEANKIQSAPFTLKDIKREIFYSTITSLVFAAITSYFKTGPLNVYSRTYAEVSSFGYAWFFTSIVFLLLIHDTYFYWMHRTVHRPALYRVIHKVHHESRNPTPFAAFSFHPFEAVLEMIWMPLLQFVLPVHQGALIIFSVTALLMNVMGHLGVELYPDSWAQHPLLKYLNRSANHNDHHKYFKGNYGLYFTWWDRLMGTFTEHVPENEKGRSFRTAPERIKADAYSSMY